MSDKKEEKTSGWLQRAVRHVKTLLPAGLIMLSSNVSAHTTSATTDENRQPTTKTINARPSNTERLVKVEAQLKQYSSKVYKGLKIDLGKIKPQDVAHIFESGMNPCITDGNKPLAKASYLGLCQMNLRSTLPNFIKQSADEFPELQNAVSKHGIRSKAFMDAWKKLSYGPKAKKFEQAQFDFMWYFYGKIFDNLAATGSFPKITKENYADDENFIYSAAVISTANQSPGGTTSIFKQARAALGKNASIADVAIKTYDIKTQKWKLKTRYKQESQLLKDKKEQLKLANLYQSFKLKNSMASFSNLKPVQIHPISIDELNSRKVAINGIEALSTSSLQINKTVIKQSAKKKNSRVFQEQTLNLALLRKKRSRD